ncbi:Serine/threonine-protein kinase [Trichinella pseudospiralis]|uniref:Uncharacterized protein n=1 Tax=Trichinella pseudospiralis TaxID=6337 RepID=A0A0V1FHW8_TRIPS|nr:hypothetical protein T4D_10521 [Trichinella pseudospiralis]
MACSAVFTSSTACLHLQVTKVGMPCLTKCRAKFRPKPVSHPVMNTAFLCKPSTTNWRLTNVSISLQATNRIMQPMSNCELPSKGYMIEEGQNLVGGCMTCIYSADEGNKRQRTDKFCKAGCQRSRHERCDLNTYSLLYVHCWRRFPVWFLLLADLDLCTGTLK